MDEQRPELEPVVAPTVTRNVLINAVAVNKILIGTSERVLKVLDANPGLDADLALLFNLNRK